MRGMVFLRPMYSPVMMTPSRRLAWMAVMMRRVPLQRPECGSRSGGAWRRHRPWVWSRATAGRRGSGSSGTQRGSSQQIRHLAGAMEWALKRTCPSPGMPRRTCSLISINSLAVVSLAYYSARLAKSFWIGPAVFSEVVVRGRHPSLLVPPRRPRLIPKENTP